MKVNGLGEFKSIQDYVNSKLQRLKSGPVDFRALFELMFSEKENIMFECSHGYRIEKISYGEACARTLAMAKVLKRRLRAYGQNSVIGLSMENGPEWIECLWAILAAGFCPLPVNLRLDGKTAENGIRAAKTAVVISDSRSYATETIRIQDILEEAGKEKPENAGEFSFGTEILMMSSGTSENLKICAYGAEELFEQILDSYRIITECRPIKRHYEGNLKLLTFLPFYHVFGLIAMYLWFGFFSRTFVKLNDMAPATILNTIKRHKVTHIFAVPLFWEKVYEEAVKAIKDRGEKQEAKFHKAMRLVQKLPDGLARVLSHLFFKEVREEMFGESISFMITGGSAIREEVLSFFNNIGYRLADGYGMTEIGITSVELSSKRKYLCHGFVGKPLCSSEYRIDEKGVLYVKSRASAAYILEGNVRREREEWFTTGDLAECIDGRYRILGRCDDLVISSLGENLNPNLIEPQLRGIEGVKEVCLVGTEKNGEKIPVVIVSINRFLDRERLSKVETDFKDRLAECALTGLVGKVFFTTDTLIKADEFKLNRRRIAKDYEQGKFTPANEAAKASGDEEDEIHRFVRKVFSVVLGTDETDISGDADFFLDLGGTSMDYFVVEAKIEEEFGVKLPNGPQDSVTSVGKMSDFINKSMN